MGEISFEGQQEGERILYIILPHTFSHTLAIGKIIVLSLVFTLIMFLIARVVPTIAVFLEVGGVLLGTLLLISGIWWNKVVYAKSKTFITDRRVFRIDVVSPFFQTKRALFWSEVLKTKAYAPNLILRMLDIGTLTITPQLAEAEDVTISHVAFYEDLANYIDKLLFIIKNTPSELAGIRPFVAKQKGQRD